MTMQNISGTMSRLDTGLTFNEERVEALSRDRSVRVLVTDLPRANEDADNIRFGATVDTVLKTYLGQYRVGAPVRDGTNNLMRWWIGIDIHRPITLIPEGNPRGSAACV